MKIPKNLQAIVKHCPRGGMDGYYVTQSQLTDFAKKIGNKYIDQVIPIAEEYVGEKCSICHGNVDKVDMNEAMYWETNTGSHGWCCPECGMVVQWG